MTEAFQTLNRTLGTSRTGFGKTIPLFLTFFFGGNRGCTSKDRNAPRKSNNHISTSHDGNSMEWMGKTCHEPLIAAGSPKAPHRHFIGYLDPFIIIISIFSGPDGQIRA